MTAQTPTAPAAWNGNHTQTVTLPSGNVAELRERFPVYLMLRTGQFSAEMFAAFNQWQKGELGDPKLASELVDLIVCAMFITPRVTMDGKDGSVSIDQIGDADIDVILEMAVGGQPDGSFPDEPDGGRGGDDGAGVAGDAVKPARSAGGKSGGAQRRQQSRGKRSGG